MILFVDSGIGGMTYMEEFLSRTIDRSCVYLADTAFFPYGEKPPEAVRDRVVSLVRSVNQAYTLEAIVIACNTASVVALEAVRKTVSIPVVGTVPAVKPAAARTRTGHIAVLATSRTVEDPYTDDLVARFARLGKVSRLGLPRLVAATEEWCADDGGSDSAVSSHLRVTGGSPRRRAEEGIEDIIREDVRARLAPDVDTIVLACTHFVRFREIFTRVLGPGVAVIDSLDGVTRRLMTVLGIEEPRGGAAASAYGADSAPGAASTPGADPAPTAASVRAGTSAGTRTASPAILLRTGPTGSGCGGDEWTIFP